MGGSSYSDDLYATRSSNRAATNTPVFAHTAAIHSGTAVAKVHDKLNPFGVKVRESRDSAAHPESLPIAVFFDVTGSMKDIPVTLQKKLPALMALLISKGYVPHPQILFGAIGDANSDAAPLQVGQFESGLEMDDDMSLMFLEGHGGGQNRETYELAHYFVLHHTATDAWEKRGAKGYLFTMGDEGFYPTIRAEQVKTLIGDTLEADLSTADVIKAIEERWHVFHLIVQEGTYPHDKTIEKAWRDLLGERVLSLDHADDVTELVASTIGVCEGTDLSTIGKNLVDIGASAATADLVTKSLVPFSKTAALAKAGTVAGTMPEVPEPVGAGVERLP